MVLLRKLYADAEAARLSEPVCDCPLCSVSGDSQWTCEEVERFDGRSPPCHCGFCTLARQEGAAAPRMTVSPALAAEFEARRGEFLRPDGIVLVIHPDQIAAFDDQRDRIMAGVDMPGRIVDDVRPDQRGESS